MQPTPGDLRDREVQSLRPQGQNDSAAPLCQAPRKAGRGRRWKGPRKWRLQPLRRFQGWTHRGPHRTTRRRLRPPWSSRTLSRRRTFLPSPPLNTMRTNLRRTNNCISLRDSHLRRGGRTCFLASGEHQIENLLVVGHLVPRPFPFVSASNKNQT